MITPILETERILLRPTKVSDADTMFSSWTTDPEVAKFMRWSVHKSVDDTIMWLTSVESNLSDEHIYDWALIYKENNDLFGTGGAYLNDEFGVYEVGYNLMKKYWGLGLATEATSAILSFAKEELKQTTFFARCAKDNSASVNVLKKLGFVYKQDSKFSSFDGERVFESFDYILDT